jgi:malto-oligosyltrehalose synthase
MTDRPTPPRATYRLQLHAGFTFDDAAAVVPYLAGLGISHAYVSPILTAQSGSTHGYDVVDPSRINPELGGEAGLRRLVAALHAHAMGLVVDIVPNHMGVGGDQNPWWLDVLRHGQASRYAKFFDIDWMPPDPSLHGRILAPFLGTPYGEALDSGDLLLVHEEAHGWAVRYHEHLFPIRPQDTPALDADAHAIDAHDAGTPDGRARLHRLLERQHYRLAWWRTGGDLINWRRFFDIAGLAGLNAGRPEVFAASHEVLLRLYAEGLIDGLRVDHVDGLADPGTYCRTLRTAMRDARPGHQGWLVVEKILAAGEALEPGWQVDGTTGYDFMNDTSLVLHDRAGLAALVADWKRRTGRPGFAQEERLARTQTLDRSFSAQLDAAAAALYRIAAFDPSDRDRPQAALRRCLARILVHFPRYRSYAAEGLGTEALQQAIAAAEPACAPADRDHLPRIADWLGTVPAGPHAGLRHDAIRRFEQLSAPIAAKSVEDTAFYRYAPLLSRNDVGFDPGERVGSIAGWHATCAQRAAAWPHAMLATATHDHKRGEDLRARLAVLSQVPEDWIACLDRWLPTLGGGLDAADAIMLLQMLVGGWPPGMAPDDAEAAAALRDRLAEWQNKAVREAKRHSSWSAPDAEYEATAAAALDRLLLDPAQAATRREIAALVERISPFGLRNGLVQTVLKLTVPGVPDIYQGTEFLDFSLVDPDNRGVVDYAARAAGGTGADGVKQHAIATLLRLRREQPELFSAGDYREIPVDSAQKLGVFAFERRAGGLILAVICSRLAAGLSGPDDPVHSDAVKAAVLARDDVSHWREVLSGPPARVLLGQLRA